MAAVWVASSSVGAATGPCSAVSNFIQSAIATVFNALTVDTSGGGLFGFLGKIWNTVVNLAFDFVIGLVKVSRSRSSTSSSRC